MTEKSRDAGQGTGPSRGKTGPQGRSAREAGGKRSTALIALLVALALAFSGFTALGVWQLFRLQWKLALIERVDSRIHAAPVAAPDTAQWPDITAASDEYRHILLRGHFLPDHDVRVQAVTVLGAGFWQISPFASDNGSIVLVNRGFVPADWQSQPSGATEVTGLLRLSEPGGGFLRHNDPAAGRWFSRDVQAIATAKGLSNVAPYFVDADAAPGTAPRLSPEGVTLAGSAPAAWPQGGLTVVRFPNNHLGYALTWFVLALMCAGAAGYLLRDEKRRRALLAGGDPGLMESSNARVRLPGEPPR